MIWRDGEMIPYAEATIHVLSHAAHRGSEVFDVLRVLDTPSGPSAVGLRPHVARFDHSMELMGMDPAFDVGALEQAVAQTVLANPGSSTVKLVASWTDVAPSTRPLTRRPTMYVAALPNYARAVELGDAIKIKTSTMPKMPASVLPPSLKVAASYTPAIRHQMEAAEEGYDDVLFLTAAGKLAEAATQSMLVVNDGRILAPPLDSVLDGITRRLLLDLAEHDQVPISVRDVHWDEVTGASELIFNSTSVFVRPVGRLDDHEFVAPGPMAERLHQQLEAMVAGQHPLAARWLTPLKGLAG